jgi:hypothetical protein
MNNINGKALSTKDILRHDIREHRKALASLTAAFRSLELEYGKMRAAFATHLHQTETAAVVLDNDATQAAFEATWHRLELDVVPHKDRPSSLSVRLLAVTDEERAEAVKAAEALKAKAKGPKLLGADGELL